MLHSRNSCLKDSESLSKSKHCKMKCKTSSRSRERLKYVFDQSLNFKLLMEFFFSLCKNAGTIWNWYFVTKIVLTYSEKNNFWGNVPGDFSEIINQNNQNPNYRKIIGIKKHAEKNRKMQVQLTGHLESCIFRKYLMLTSLMLSFIRFLQVECNI